MNAQVDNGQVAYGEQARAFLARRLAEGLPITTQEEIMSGLCILGEERTRIYQLIKRMKRRGELEPEKEGFRYVPAAAPDTITERVYRIIRAHKGDFTAQEVASLAEADLKRVRESLQGLTQEGFVKEVGKRGARQAWLLTRLGRETPNPPKVWGKDFISARRALGRLVEIFLTAGNLEGVNTRQAIREQLEILNRRFGAEKGRT